MWKDIKGYEGLYQISDKGEVRRLLKDGRTKPVKPRDGVYYTVSLSKDCKYTSFNVHRLVAEHFLEKTAEQTEVNHKDGDKKNNNVENLEWVTQKENLIHAMEQLNHYPFGKPNRRVKCINPETDEVVQEFYSLAEAARSIGKTSARVGITACCNGLQNSAYGYKWQYAD